MSGVSRVVSVLFLALALNLLYAVVFAATPVAPKRCLGDVDFTNLAQPRMLLVCQGSFQQTYPVYRNGTTVRAEWTASLLVAIEEVDDPLLPRENQTIIEQFLALDMRCSPTIAEYVAIDATSQAAVRVRELRTLATMANNATILIVARMYNATVVVGRAAPRTVTPTDLYTTYTIANWPFNDTSNSLQIKISLQLDGLSSEKHSERDVVEQTNWRTSTLSKASYQSYYSKPTKYILDDNVMDVVEQNPSEGNSSFSINADYWVVFPFFSQFATYDITASILLLNDSSVQTRFAGKLPVSPETLNIPEYLPPETQVTPSTIIVGRPIGSTEMDATLKIVTIIILVVLGAIIALVAAFALRARCKRPPVDAAAPSSPQDLDSSSQPSSSQPSSTSEPK